MTRFNTSLTLAAPVHSVFAAFQNPSTLAQWWGPDGFTNTIHAFEFQAGGRWSLTMHGPDGTDYLNELTFLKVQAPHHIVVKHVNAPHFTLDITLSPSTTGTLIDWVQTFEDPAVAQAVRHIVEPANDQNLARWAQVVLQSAG